MSSPFQCTVVCSVPIVAVNGRNLELLMAALHLFEAIPIVAAPASSLSCCGFPTKARHAWSHGSIREPSAGLCRCGQALPISRLSGAAIAAARTSDVGPIATVGAVQRHVRSWVNSGSGWIASKGVMTFGRTPKLTLDPRHVIAGPSASSW